MCSDWDRTQQCCLWRIRYWPDAEPEVDRPRPASGDFWSPYGESQSAPLFQLPYCLSTISVVLYKWIAKFRMQVRCLRRGPFPVCPFVDQSPRPALFARNGSSFGSEHQDFVSVVQPKFETTTRWTKILYVILRCDVQPPIKYTPPLDKPL